MVRSGCKHCQGLRLFRNIKLLLRPTVLDRLRQSMSQSLYCNRESRTNVSILYHCFRRVVIHPPGARLRAIPEPGCLLHAQERSHIHHFRRVIIHPQVPRPRAVPKAGYLFHGRGSNNNPSVSFPRDPCRCQWSCLETLGPQLPGCPAS